MQKIIFVAGRGRAAKNKYCTGGGERRNDPSTGLRMRRLVGSGRVLRFTEE